MRHVSPIQWPLISKSFEIMSNNILRLSVLICFLNCIVRFLAFSPPSFSHAFSLSLIMSAASFVMFSFSCLACFGMCSFAACFHVCVSVL